MTPRKFPLPKNLGFVILAVSAVLILALAFGLRPYFAEHRAEAAGPILSDPVDSLSDQLLVASAEPVDASTNNGGESASLVPKAGILAQVVNGVEVQAGNFRLENGQLRADVCFDLLDDSDWTIWGLVLKYGEVEIAEYSSYPIEIRKVPLAGQQKVTTFDEQGNKVVSSEPASADQKGRRCDTLSFNLPDGAESTAFTLTIHSIAAYPREGEVCEAEYLDKVQSALDARNSGIKVQCFMGEGIEGLEVVEKPASLSQEDAQAFIYSDEFFLDVHGIRGPWVFPIGPK